MSAGEIDLQPGERVLWAGEPVRRPALTQSDLLVVPFGLLCIAAALVLMPGHNGERTTEILLLVLLVFGVLLAVVRPFLRYLALGKTTYAVTDNRVITTSGLFRQTERSRDLAGLDEPVLRRGKAGTGTITFGDRVALAGIGQPAKVRDLLVKAIEEARSRAGSTPEPDASTS